ncbi:dual specificity protein phosphatase 22 isoform X4 [Halichoerus grypus]
MVHKCLCGRWNCPAIAGSGLSNLLGFALGSFCSLQAFPTAWKWWPPNLRPGGAKNSGPRSSVSPQRKAINHSRLPGLLLHSVLTRPVTERFYLWHPTPCGVFKPSRSLRCAPALLLLGRKILPGLYIGNFKDARDAEQLSKNKVTHILSVHDSARPLLEGVKYLCIPAADSPSQNLTRHFKESIKFIHECRLRGEGCLVHCLAGVSRSVTLVIAYIMTVTDFGWEDALHTVRAGRSCANPNLGFQRQLQEFEKHEVHQYRQWLKEEYGESPLRDVEEAKNILATAGILKHWAFLRRL